MRGPDSGPDDPELYGHQWSADYDAMERALSNDLEDTIAALAKLAGAGPVLEAGAGTGRIAVPLAERGLRVVATDASADMLAALRAKDPQHKIIARQEVLPAISGHERFSLISLLVNSLWHLTTATEQRAFLRNAVTHLAPGGVVVIEMGATAVMKLDKRLTFHVGDTTIVRTTSWNPVTQRVLNRFEITRPGSKSPEVRENLSRLVLPEELLLMGELEGLRPRFIWENWRTHPFTSASRHMITIFEADTRDQTATKPHYTLSDW